jgi:hypothetical protein
MLHVQCDNMTFKQKCTRLYERRSHISGRWFARVTPLDMCRRVAARTRATIDVKFLGSDDGKCVLITCHPRGNQVKCLSLFLVIGT